MIHIDSIEHFERTEHSRLTYMTEASQLGRRPGDTFSPLDVEGRNMGLYVQFEDEHIERFVIERAGKTDDGDVFEWALSGLDSGASIIVIND